jgi:hypothetical protein
MEKKVVMGQDEPRHKKLEGEVRIYQPIKSLFLWDVLTDRDSRPALYWAGLTLLLGTLVYILLALFDRIRIVRTQRMSADLARLDPSNTSHQE